MRIMCGFCDTIYDSGDPEQREMHSHGTAAPERAESTSTDALWREYEEARDAAVRRAFRDGRAGVPDDDESDAMTEARARLDAAVRALAAGDGQDSRAWRPVHPNNLPEPQWMLVTNNIDARDARGDMSHLWLVYMLHAPSLSEPQYGVTAFSGNRRICYITHWRPAIPEGADRMIVAATDPKGA